METFVYNHLSVPGATIALHIIRRHDTSLSHSISLPSSNAFGPILFKRSKRCIVRISRIGTSSQRVALNMLFAMI